MKPSRTVALFSAAASIVAAALLLSGCAPRPTLQASPAGVLNFQHIHELTAVGGGGALLVGTHVGLYRLSIDSTGSTMAVGPIGGLDFDPMGFTIANGVAYASGHPGPTTPKAVGSPDLGLIISTNLGQSWRNASLTGTGDFHGLAVMTVGTALPRVFGYDSSMQRLRCSLDGGATWTDGPMLVARDLLAVGAVLYATTPDGLAVSRDEGVTFTVDPAAPMLYLIASGHDGALAGVDVDGRIWTQSPGQSWIRGGPVTGTAQALAVDGHRIYVADDRGIALTDHGGASWLVLKVHK